MSTYLRPRHGGRAVLLSTPIPSASTTLKSTTILERRLARQALLNAQIIPKARRVPSLYYNPTTLFLYIFNHDFYNNKDIINSNISFKNAVFSYKTNR
jgi:hypothetical protein